MSSKAGTKSATTSRSAGRKSTASGPVAPDAGIAIPIGQPDPTAPLILTMAQGFILLAPLPLPDGAPATRIDRPQMLVDGNPVSAQMMFLATREGGQLMVALCPGTLNTRHHIAWQSSSHGALSIGRPGKDVTRSPASAELLIGHLAQTTAPARPLRRIVDFLAGQKPANRDHQTIELVAGLLSRLAEPRTLRARACWPLSQNSCLLMLELPAGMPAVEGTVLVGSDSVERSIAPSVQPETSLPGFIMVEQPVDTVLTGQLYGKIGNRTLLIETAAAPRQDWPALLDWLRRTQNGRNRLVRFLGDLLGRHRADNPALVPILAQISSLRTATGPSGFNQPGMAALTLSQVVREPGGQMLLFGWRRDPHQLIADLCWVAPNGRRLSLIRQMQPLAHRGSKGDIKPEFAPNEGFVARLQTPPTGIPYIAQEFELRLISGQTVTLDCPCNAGNNHRQARDLLLALPVQQIMPRQPLVDSLAPVLGPVHRAVLAVDRVEQVETVGTLPEHPRCSLIVPIYRNLAFLQVMAIALATDADLAGDELIMVIDDPDNAALIREHLQLYHRLYGLNVKLVQHRENYGYAPAINSGVAQARGDALLFLNSDVVPISPGWLGRLYRKLKHRRNHGAVAPKLLFGNGTIQHAGVSFYRDAQQRVYNRSPFKGYPAGFAAANQPGAVEALTGACLLLRREALEAAGGLSEDYIIGDFEDTDLCLRLKQAGYSLYYEPRVSLYHFERQSIEHHDLHRLTLAEQYNQWQQQSRWFDAPSTGGTTIGTAAHRAATD